MSETPFFLTAMGRTYYERTLPALVREVARLSEVLAQLVQRLPPASTPQTGQDEHKEETP